MPPISAADYFKKYSVTPSAPTETGILPPSPDPAPSFAEQYFVRRTEDQINRINSARPPGEQIDAAGALEDIRLMGRTGLPLSIVRPNRAELAIRVKEKGVTGERIRKSPRVGRWMADHPEWADYFVAQPDELKRAEMQETLLSRPPELWPMSEQAMEAEAQRLAEDPGSESGFEPSFIVDLFTGTGTKENAFARKKARFLADIRKREAIFGGTGELGLTETTGEELKRNPFALIPLVREVQPAVEMFFLRDAAKAFEAGTAT